MYPLKLLVSVIHNTEFSVESQTGMFIYVCVLMSAINTLYMNLAGVDVEALQPEEVLLEAKEILLEGEFYNYMYLI